MSHFPTSPPPTQPGPPQGYSQPPMTGGYDTSTLGPQGMPQGMPAPPPTAPPQGGVDPTGGGIPTAQSFMSHLAPQPRGAAPAPSAFDQFGTGNIIDPTRFAQETQQIQQGNSQTQLFEERARAMGEQNSQFASLTGSLTGILKDAAAQTKSMRGSVGGG